MSALGGTMDAKLEFLGPCPGTELPQTNIILWQGRTLFARLESCTLTIVAREPVFRRGDVNADAKLDIADPIYLLGCKFRGTACPPCWDAADANDDGESDVTDAIVILAYIFLAGIPPPLPGPFANQRHARDAVQRTERPVCRASVGTGPKPGGTTLSRMALSRPMDFEQETFPRPARSCRSP